MDKEEVRQRVWALLEEQGAARFPGARGRIPNFVGAEAAAALLAEQTEWEAAETLKANPDSPQLPVRRRARKDGKQLYMAVPRLRDEKHLRPGPRRSDDQARPRRGEARGA
jgi:5-formyltetrahydrofolate cyclo-ligase